MLTGSVPLLPLVVWQVEEPRVVLALLALGGLREARSRFGGLGVLAVAIDVLRTADGERREAGHRARLG